MIDSPSHETADAESSDRGAVVWTDDNGDQYTIRSVAGGGVSVSKGDAALGRVPVPIALKPLASASNAQLRAIVEAALRERPLKRWVNEGGAVPEEERGK